MINTREKIRSICRKVFEVHVIHVFLCRCLCTTSVAEQDAVVVAREIVTLPPRFLVPAKRERERETERERERETEAPKCMPTHTHVHTHTHARMHIHTATSKFSHSCKPRIFHSAASAMPLLFARHDVEGNSSPQKPADGNFPL